MARVIEVHDGPDQTGSNTAVIIGVVVVVAVVLIGLVFL